MKSLGRFLSTAVEGSTNMEATASSLALVRLKLSVSYQRSMSVVTQIFKETYSLSTQLYYTFNSHLSRVL